MSLSFLFFFLPRQRSFRGTLRGARQRGQTCRVGDGICASLKCACVRYWEPAPVSRGLFTAKLGGKGAVWRIDLRVYVAVMAFRNFIFKPDAVYRKAREMLARQSTEPLRLQVCCPIFRDFGFWQLKDFLLTIDSLHCSC